MLDNFKIISGEEAKDQLVLTKQLIKIDYECFGKVPIEDEGTADKWTAIREACFMQVIYDKETPIGYIDFVALKPEGINKLLAANLRDGEVPDYVNTTESSQLNLYIAVIAILSAYRGRGFSKLLWNKSKDYFISKGHSVNSLYANIWTDDGWNFFNHFDSEVICMDKDKHSIIQLKIENGQLPLYV